MWKRKQAPEQGLTMAASVSKATASSDSATGASAAGPTSMGVGPSVAAVAASLTLPSSDGDCTTVRSGSSTAAVRWPPSIGVAGDAMPTEGDAVERPLGSA